MAKYSFGISNKKISAWIEALRLRTLPLAAAGVIIAAGIAHYFNAFNWTIFILMLLMALGMQILSNFADEYGDLASGLDDSSRVGPIRALQRGDISKHDMKNAMLICSIINLALVVLLLMASFGASHPLGYMSFLVLGVLCIVAAIAYTIGPKPYGYIGLGDLMSFIFFGLIAVIGGSYLYTKQLEPSILLPAIGLGLPTIAVLNLNNMRDARDDKNKGKRTVANMLGDEKMRYYHISLLALSALCFLAYLIAYQAINFWIVPLFICFGVWALTCYEVMHIRLVRKFDKLMKPTSLTTIFVAIFFALSLIFA